MREEGSLGRREPDEDRYVILQAFRVQQKPQP